ncbi:bifunctional 3-deoxy-7-phosphoheptulonate synthase/chorismate mutase type II [Flammeovirgaceae bacterium SG7u.111]|nr:bifunctional 3-deoxy-7-phosphoheptulonate synthase/chorismate mutase type II [Flammeovirgaceae bacterium SG7u.132]WPO37331.1 bifunctional 3-deoxy-7-phosphoheptulonate synthase/chorismate mutase type II [Flammeovirgaceae bacterium SG7u.111]
MDIQPISSWKVIKNLPFAIAGPCSAETEEQLYTTCKGIKELDITMLRAGIWKPRTRPGQFEGVGEVGLQWFQKIKKELEMPACVEVATAKHVELALKYDMDVLWIGARSTVNPFTVQEIADALRGVDIPVMVKNPINPDLALWKGSIERIYQAGITQIAGIHRGFSSFEKTKYRNVPMWQLAIAMKSDLPTLPMICDPSHIAGNRELLLPVSQKAIDLNYDGLMIETHCNPSVAMSDAKQQVTPAGLKDILDAIKIRQVSSDNMEFNSILQTMRNQIDEVDREILENLATRQSMVDKLGEYKKDNNVTVFQANRWLEVFKTRVDWGKQLNLDDEFIGKFFKVVHDEAIKRQSSIMNKENVE